MTHELAVLLLWIRVVAIIASICTTAVPIMYSFSPWRSRLIGKLFMLQAIAFAVAMDLTALFSFWHPRDILVVFMIDASVLTAVAASTAALTILMWKMNYSQKK